MASFSNTSMLGLPAEIKIAILKNLDGRNAYSMFQVDTDFLLLWQQYTRQICRAIWQNIHHMLHPEARSEAHTVFRLREARREHMEALGARSEDAEARSVLEGKMKAILLDHNTAEDESSSSNYSKIESLMDIESLVTYSDMVSEVNSLVDRYANDAWQRIRRIALETGTSNPSPADTLLSSPKTTLTAEERGRFQKAFLTAEIYLLTTFHTNGQGERHRFDTGGAIYRYIPYVATISTQAGRRQFDSCIRYIFHAYRAHLRKTARELGVPEFPQQQYNVEDKDEPPRKRQRIFYHSSPEHHSRERERRDPFSGLDEKTRKFAQRTIEDEQRFLLWLCEFGIGPLEQTHKAPSSVRRAEMLEQFGRSHVWDNGARLKHVRHFNSRLNHTIRQQHPVKNLYGFHHCPKYERSGTPWACASVFLEWEWSDPNGMSRIRRRGDVVLNEHGRWITMSDTDSGNSDWNPFESQSYEVPEDHPYILDQKQYSFRSLPKRVFLVEP
ncbi:hypothetical protein VM1G_02513 [Cytospora mali]|uniref:F-box domain-containing protein n=1 Tax=Cytospora mali TaxID=578113 RepID=A0A194VPC8_CYTMA|nr:hypothetical protein VM1G_02513 [Valsa mali]